MRSKHTKADVPWRILTACILAASVSLSLSNNLAGGEPEKGPQGQAKVVAPPIDLGIDDIKEIKDKVEKIKPIMEKDREPTVIRVRDIEPGSRTVPRIQLVHGYGTVIVLPYQFELSNVALGNKEKFQVESKGNSIIIFPLQEFKSTNLVVFETAAGELIPHHYLLTENSHEGVADFTVKVNKRRPGDVGNISDAIVKVLLTQRIPDQETPGWSFFEGRAPIVKDLRGAPFMRKLTLLSPGLNAYLINGRVSPVGDVEWCVYPDNTTTVVATKKDRLIVRRLSDGKTFSSN